MRGADRESRMAAIDHVEIHELLERLAQRLGRVIAGKIGAERNMRAEKGAGVGLEKAGNPAGERRPCGERVGDVQHRFFARYFSWGFRPRTGSLGGKRVGR